MEILVTYDVATDTAEGRARLRRVAKTCEAYGQRVQKSVFECTLNPTDMELLMYKLRSIVNVAEDSLRVYRLREPREKYLQIIGVKPQFDIHDPLVL